MNKWAAILGCFLVIGFFGAIGVMAWSENQVDIEKEKTHQLELQIELEKAKK